MGLFDRFRKRVTEVASEVDTDALSAEADTKEAQEALESAQKPSPKPQAPIEQNQVIEPEVEEEWEDLEALDESESLESASEDWDDFESIICEPISVSGAKKIKILKRGWRNLIKDPLILFNKIFVTSMTFSGRLVTSKSIVPRSDILVARHSIE